MQNHAQSYLSAKHYSLKPYLKFKLYFSDKTLTSDISFLNDLRTLLLSLLSGERSSSIITLRATKEQEQAPALPSPMEGSAQLGTTAREITT